MTDGPYTEAKEVIASFSIIQADNYDAAVAIAKESHWPHLIATVHLALASGYLSAERHAEAIALYQSLNAAAEPSTM